ncbi:MAG TPA: ACP S-malonyltransferase [Candidatus Lustribacter sp.]
MRVGVVFPGQGSQTRGMGADVAAGYPAAGALYREAKTILGYDLLALCADGLEDQLRETRYGQAAIFVTNIALASAVGDVLTPVVSAGHSFGEYCSLAMAGALSFETALALVNQRGLAMHRAASLARGAMSAVIGLDDTLLRQAVALAIERGAGRVQLANFNQPGQVVISGDETAVRVAGELALEAGAKRVIRLNVSGAWHSALMEPAREEFAKHIADAPIIMPRFTVVSNVDAQPYTSVEQIKTNLIRSVTDEVRWHEAAIAMIAAGIELIVEFGASPVLAPMMKRVAGAPKAMHVGDAAGVEKLRALLAPAEVT